MTRRTCSVVDCHREPTWHFLMSAHDVAFTCSGHSWMATQRGPVDYHPMADVCHLSLAEEPRLSWHPSTPLLNGYCFLDGDPDHEELVRIDQAEAEERQTFVVERRS